MSYLFASSTGTGTGSPAGDDLAGRFAPPPDATRATLPPRSFGQWLRYLPLLPAGQPVLLWNGRPKARQEVHAAVVALDVGHRDLQQCADAVMRLRAEYLLALGRPELIRFHPDPGKPRALAFSIKGEGMSGGGSRADFMRYMTRVFAEAGSASLQAELERLPAAAAVQPGDVLIQGGYPGHAVLVLDVASDGRGRRYLLLGQSYMPAQQFHLLKNLSDPSLSPWYDAAALDTPGGLLTPEWRPFHRSDLRRFPAQPGVP